MITINLNLISFLDNVTVTLGGHTAMIINATDFNVTVLLPSLSPGLYPLMISVGNFGYADLGYFK